MTTGKAAPINIIVSAENWETRRVEGEELVAVEIQPRVCVKMRKSEAIEKGMWPPPQPSPASQGRGKRRAEGKNKMRVPAEDKAPHPNPLPGGEGESPRPRGGG